jgi:hypothetical protein
MRQHLHVDPGLVHFSEPQFADIVEPLHDVRRGDRVEAAEVLFYLRIVVMLLQGDDLGLRRHRFPPSANCHPGMRSTGLIAAPSTASAAARLISAKS